MILRHFPGHGNNSQGEADFSCFHRENVIIYAKSSDVAYATHTAPLSIKSCVKGKEIYEINDVPIAVEESKYLVINNGELYASYILSNEEVESFCVFFQDGIERDVLAVFENSHENLLDNPAGKDSRMIPFFQNLRHQNALISPILHKIYKETGEGQASQFWLDEQCAALIEALLREHLQILKETVKLPMLQQTTRIEIYRRLCLARDYIESCYDEAINLKELAKIACLSQFHFLRLFKAAFHQTPYQYLLSVRLQKAFRQLKENKFSVTAVCLNVGFENPSSFARAFKSRFGLSPQEVRGNKSNFRTV